MAEPARFSGAESVLGPNEPPPPTRPRSHKHRSTSNRKRSSDIVGAAPSKRSRRLSTGPSATATDKTGHSEHRGRGNSRPPASDSLHLKQATAVDVEVARNTAINGRLNTDPQLAGSRSSCSVRSSRSNSVNSSTTEENFVVTSNKSPYTPRRNDFKAIKKSTTPRGSPSRDSTSGALKKNISLPKTNSLASLSKSKNKSTSNIESCSNWDVLSDKPHRKEGKQSKSKKREESSSSSATKQNLTFPPDNTGSHKYTLRSQVKLSSSEPTGLVSRLSQFGRRAVSTKKKTKSETKTKEVVVEDNPGPSTATASRLSRSTGVVLRRSTRNSKGTASTTGSCASSGGSGTAGSSSRRSGGGNKVSAMSTTQPQQPQLDSNSTVTTANPPAPNLQEPPSPQEGTQASASSGIPSGPGADSESDDSEVGRLQALLEARGLPPHLFGALGPRMQHLLHRSMGAGSSSKAQQLLQGLQATGDEGQQLQSVIEMCQMLVMGNEDTLTGFPVKQVVPALITLLNMEHNFDMMNHACRALTYMMEALPRSSAVVVDAVPVFLEKLQVIQCMDVAEQSLTALDMLSRRHSKAILQARGVSACLMYLDFFSINAQRAALSVTANCCQNLSADEYQLVADSIPLLAARLAQLDRRSVECVCLAFSRLTDSMQHDPARLQEIATPKLLTNLQQLLVVTPPVISTGTFITVLRMLSVLCATCPDLALTLLRQNIAETILYLLTGNAAASSVANGEIELVPRSPQELYEITCLIGELMPKLPTDGIFAVDALLERPNQLIQDTVSWQWKDDRGVWHQYSAVDSRIIEAAHLGGEDEVSLTTMGRTYTIDLHVMQQLNEDTGTTRPVQRRFTPVGQNSNQSQPQDIEGAHARGDTRVTCLREENGLAASFIRSLFSVLYEVYSSSAGPAVRCKCLRALLRMVYYANGDLLRDVLKNQIVSSHIAGMMASNDLRIVVGALQMAEILMSKLPDEFGVHFRREGVMHQITQLADPQVPLGVSPPKISNISFNSTLNDSTIQPQPSTSSTNISLNATPLSGSSVGTSNGTGSGPSRVSTALIFTSSPAENHIEMTEVKSPNPSQARLSDVLKRKRAPKRSSNGSRSKSRQDDLNLSSSLMQDLFSKATSLGSSAGRSTPTSGNSNRSRFTGASTKTSSFLASLNPARWGRSLNHSSLERNYSKDGSNLNCLSKSLSQHNLTAGHREKARTWVREQSGKFLELHSEEKSAGPPHPASNVLSSLKSAIERLQSPSSLQALQELRDILMESYISRFEVNHSGLIKALLTYLAEEEGNLVPRDQRLRTFMHVFAGFPIEQHSTQYFLMNSSWFAALVSKLNGCVSQLEQFPVRVHDLPAGSGRGNTSALKFFNTHQLKCNLQRHPDCNNLKQWKGGTVKIDPLALVQAIERYLVVRGYGRLRDKDSGDSDDDNSDEDIDDTLAAVVISQGGSKHKLQFLIGNHVLPYNMTVYQAVKQYSSTGNDQSETDTDTETPLGNAGVWVQTHTIYYRPLTEDSHSNSKLTLSYSSGSGRKGKGSSSKSNHKRKGDDLWNEGHVPKMASPLKPFLAVKLPESVTIQDPSLEVLCLIRVLNALNRYWASLYIGIEQKNIIPQSEFINNKLAAKASRQLQDPLVIMTGNLPAWLSQIAVVCPFLFPFETRQLLFYATSFDRDRALQRLLDTTPELSAADSSERVTPRLDRRKRTISREDILRQAEQVIHDLAGSKALLEVQYENEVGTGLGPTLEFYALVSKELQRNELELWKNHSNPNEVTTFVNSPTGLFPTPLGRPTKVSHISKIKAKFRFLGKFMAKAVMDSRMLDLPFSLPFHRWLLGQEHSLSLADLSEVAPDVHRTLTRLQSVVYQRDTINADTSLTYAERSEQCERLTLDGCSIADLGLDFILPGHSTVELIRGGRDTPVTIHNLDEYLRLVSHWFMYEGVVRQMEALREGFESVFPIRQLRMFYPEELEEVFCGSSQSHDLNWDVRTLIECCRPDHGYTVDSRAVRLLFEVLSNYNREEQRQFVQFVTGSPRLPVGGFRALTPPLTVVRKTLDPNMNADDYLPSVMTCVNYLKLPDYSTVEVMQSKLRTAANEGQHSFHLS